MPFATYHAWLSLYTGVGILVALCAMLAVFKTAYDFQSGAAVLTFRNWRDTATALLNLWWRWQLNYLSGAPVILLIAMMFAHYLGFATLVDV